MLFTQYDFVHKLRDFASHFPDLSGRQAVADWHVTALEVMSQGTNPFHQGAIPTGTAHRQGCWPLPGTWTWRLDSNLQLTTTLIKVAQDPCHPTMSFLRDI